MKPFFCLILLFFVSGSLQAGTEAERIAQILDLIPKREKLAASGDTEGAFAIDAKLSLLPAPDSADYSKFLIGSWRSPRHDYLYRKDGTWSMLPLEPDSTGGHWKLKGNKLTSWVGNASQEALSKSDTIILLNEKFFITTYDGYVFYQKRLKDKVP